MDEARQSVRYMAEAALRYGKVGSLSQLLDRVAAFRQYKPYNALLVLLQRPAATYVLPAHVWGERYGRVIRPGEQPLVMLQYRGPVMFLFDASQTEEGPHPKPLPMQLRNPYGMKDTPGADLALRWVVENAKYDGVRVQDAPFGLPYAGRISHSESGGRLELRRPRTGATRSLAIRYEVLLNRSYSATEQLATLGHELGHLYCGHLGPDENELFPGEQFWRSRPLLPEEVQELEAESVARVVFRTLDPENPLPDHLSRYFAKEPEIAGVDLEPILTAAGRILEMAHGHAPRRPRHRRLPAQPPPPPEPPTLF